MVGSLHYIAAHTRPDLAANASIFQGAAKSPKVHHLEEANKVLRRARKHADTKIIFNEIPMADLKFTAYNEAAWTNRYDLSSQGGTIILAHGRGFYEDRKEKVSVVEWSSRILARVAKSSLSAELQSNSTCIDNFVFLLLTWDAIHNTQHGRTSEQRIRQAKKWAGGCIIDHKGLYDIFLF